MIVTVVVRVECDLCGDDELYELINLEKRELAGAMNDDGWTTDRQDRDGNKQMLCYRCSNPTAAWKRKRKRRAV